jgi:hypothetical protein
VDFNDSWIDWGGVVALARLQDYSFSDDLFALAQEDASIRAIVDKSTERILKIKYDLGLFTNPFASNLSNPNIATVRLPALLMSKPNLMAFFAACVWAGGEQERSSHVRERGAGVAHAAQEPGQRPPSLRHGALTTSHYLLATGHRLSEQQPFTHSILTPSAGAEDSGGRSRC